MYIVKKLARQILLSIHVRVPLHIYLSLTRTHLFLGRKKTSNLR